MDTVASKHNARQIRDALGHLPGGLSEMYNVTMERICCQQEEGRKLALNILMWITCSFRRLTSQELQYAVALAQQGTRGITPDDITDIQLLLECCCGLVVLDEKCDTIQLIHYSAQEYFMTAQQTYFPNAQTEIALTCIRHLSFDTRPCWLDDFLMGDMDAQFEQEFPLLEYAVRFWTLHVRRGSGEFLTSLVIHYLSQRDNVFATFWLGEIFLEREWNGTWSVDCPQSECHYTGYQYREQWPSWMSEPDSYEKEDVLNSHYHRAALTLHLGLTDVWAYYEAQGLVGRNSMHQLGDETDPYEGPSICVASRAGDVRQLLSQGVDPESNFIFIFTYSVLICDPETQKVSVIGAGRRYGMQQKQGTKSLCTLLSLGNAGANAAARDSLGVTPLIAAAGEGRLKVV